MKTKKSRFFAITEEKTCGHMHRSYGRAVDCLDKFEDAGIPADIIETRENVDLLWVDHHLLKRTTMAEFITAFKN